PLLVPLAATLAPAFQFRPFNRYLAGIDVVYARRTVPRHGVHHVPSPADHRPEDDPAGVQHQTLLLDAGPNLDLVSGRALAAARVPLRHGRELRDSHPDSREGGLG